MLTNPETLLGNKPLADADVRAAMRYTDCLGRTVQRTLEQAIAHVETLRAEKADRDARRQRHLEHVQQQVRQFRLASGLCLRDRECLRRDGHADECVHDRRHLAMVEGAQ